MINKFTSPSERTDLDNTGVGVLALISMYHVVLFLILQILVFVVLLPVVFLLPELGALNEKTAGIVSLAILVVVDITLITVLARRGRRSFSEQMEMARTRGMYRSMRALRALAERELW